MLKRLRGWLSPSPDAQDLPFDNDTLLVNAYCTLASIPILAVPHTLHCQRDLTDPEMAGHLEGFVGYVLNAGNGEMSRVRYHVIRHIQRVQQQLSFSIQRAHLAALASWARKANAILFLPDGSVRDPEGRLLVGSQNKQVPDSQADVPYPDAAWKRKQRTDGFLSSLGLTVPSSLPPLVSEGEVQLRPPAEVTSRLFALSAVAIRAESMSGGNALSVAEIRERLPNAFLSLTPQEEDFLSQETPAREAITAMGWRYEGLMTLVWALGLVHALPFPSDICNVSLLVRTVMELPTSRPQACLLRPAAEILDTLDLHYRLHWFVRQSRLDGQTLPVQLESGVIAERHHALNWLVRFEGRDWDNVDTPT